jgi:methionine synthase I (cobalamin-dependent)
MEESPMEMQFPVILDGATGTELQKRGFTGECLTVCYEPVTGSHVGPGTVALFFQGIHR